MNSIVCNSDLENKANLQTSAALSTGETQLYYGTILICNYPVGD